MDVELSGITSSFDHPALREGEEEKREITETCVKANKFFKGVLNRYAGNPTIEQWAQKSHQDLRRALSERLVSVSSRVSDDLRERGVNINHSE